MPKWRPVAERFWEKVHKSPEPDGCWEWTASRCSSGYGTFGIEGKTVAAHRLSWELQVGQIPRGLCVLHGCDNPPCIKIDHLHLGTLKDNSREAVERKRLWTTKRTRCPCGGPYSLNKRGYRFCRTCQNKHVLKWERNNREAYLASRRRSRLKHLAKTREKDRIYAQRRRDILKGKVSA